jgi:hypothetical protein
LAAIGSATTRDRKGDGDRGKDGKNALESRHELKSSRAFFASTKIR